MPPAWKRVYASTRRSLIEKLGDWDDAASWQEFYRTYWKLIYSVALKSGLREDEAADVVQETILCIARQSREGRYDPEKGSFKGWLLNVTRWRIADQLRRRRRRDREVALVDEPGQATAAVERLPDPRGDPLAEAWESEWRQNVLDQALAAVRRRVSAHQFQIFQSYVIEQWPVQQVVQRLGVSRAQVYLAKHRVGQILRKEVARVENQSL